MAQEEQQQGQAATEPPAAPPEPGPDWGRASSYLYQHRVSGKLWAVLVPLSIGSAAAGFYLLKFFAFLTGAYLDEWMKSPGPWTALIVLTGLPVGLFVWFVRDRNKAMDHWQEQQRLAQNATQQQIAFGQHLHRTVEHAWVHFRHLQESITSGNTILQTAAIHQLRPFIMGESGGVIPKELLEPENHFISSAMAVLRALLDDRYWLEKWKKDIRGEKDDAELPQSPVLDAIEALLRAKGLPWTDFAGWNLSGLNLSEVVWEDADLWGANLQNTDFLWANLNNASMGHVNLQKASLQGTGLRGAYLERADMDQADLRRADLNGANLDGASLNKSDLSGAYLNEAYLTNVNLTAAVLWDTDFRGADLTDARIEEKWRDVIDWEDFNLKGMPTFIKNHTEELRPKPAWLVELKAAEPAKEAEEESTE